MLRLRHEVLEESEMRTGRASNLAAFSRGESMLGSAHNRLRDPASTKEAYF
jgi:hypothetical protein